MEKYAKELPYSLLTPISPEGIITLYVNHSQNGASALWWIAVLFWVVYIFFSTLTTSRENNQFLSCVTIIIRMTFFGCPGADGHTYVRPE